MMIYLTCSLGIDDEAIIDIDVLTEANQLSSESCDSQSFNWCQFESFHFKKHVWSPNT